jgi:hypothetical protein
MVWNSRSTTEDTEEQSRSLLGFNLSVLRVQQIDAAGRDIIVGSYQLQPGASVDVSALARAPGRDGEFRFKVLKGSVSVTASGRTRTLKPGERATMLIDRISAILPLPAR